MSDRREERQAERDAPDAPPTDTPEQAEARQMVQSNPQVTYVADPLAVPVVEETDDHSLAVLAAKVDAAKAKVAERQAEPHSAASSTTKDSKK